MRAKPVCGRSNGGGGGFCVSGSAVASASRLASVGIAGWRAAPHHDPRHDQYQRCSFHPVRPVIHHHFILPRQHESAKARSDSADQYQAQVKSVYLTFNLLAPCA
jgi:hypothetical protein